MNDASIEKAVVRSSEFTDSPEYESRVMVDIKLVFPEVFVPHKPVSTVKISNYYRQIAKTGFDYAHNELFNQAKEAYIENKQNVFHFFNYVYMMTYAVAYNKNSILSIYYDIYEYTGGAHGLTTRYSDTWNIIEAKTYNLKTIFGSKGYRTIIYDYIAKEIMRQIDKEEAYYFDDYTKNIIEYFDPRNFYLADENLVFYYPLYSLAPYSSGIVEFKIPFSYLGMGC